MFIKKEPYFTKEVEIEHPEPHSWDSSEHGLWVYNLMHGFKSNKNSNFDAAFKEAVKMLERGNQMEKHVKDGESSEGFFEKVSREQQALDANGKLELFKSIRKVRNGIKIVKDATNPHFKSGYAKLDQIIPKLDTVVEQYGLEYNQRCEKETIFTKVLHENGHYIVTECPVLNKKGDSQGYGSGQTYAMRYGLCMAFGIAPTEDNGAGAYDDDGNAASAKPVNDSQPSDPGDFLVTIGYDSVKGRKLSELSESQID